MTGNGSEVGRAAGAFPDREHLKYIRGLLSDEVKYRRDRRQQIVTWASTFLLAIIGAGNALAPASAPAGQKYPLYVAIILVGILSIAWLNYHHLKEKRFRFLMQEYDRQLKLPLNLNEGKQFDLAMNLALFGLTVLAFVFTFYHLGR